MGLKGEDLNPRGQRSVMFELDIENKMLIMMIIQDNNYNGVYNEHKFSHTL